MWNGVSLFFNYYLATSWQRGKAFPGSKANRKHNSDFTHSWKKPPCRTKKYPYQLDKVRQRSVRFQPDELLNCTKHRIPSRRGWKCEGGASIQAEACWHVLVAHGIVCISIWQLMRECTVSLTRASNGERNASRMNKQGVWQRCKSLKNTQSDFSEGLFKVTFTFISTGWQVTIIHPGKKTTSGVFRILHLINSESRWRFSVPDDAIFGAKYSKFLLHKSGHGD